MVFSFFIAWLRQAQPPCYSRCLSLSKAEVIFCSSGDLDSAQSPCYFRCLSLSKADSYSSRWFRQAQSPCYFRCLSLSKAGSHSSSCDFDKLNHRVTLGAWACRRQILLSLWFRLRSITGIMFQPSVTEPMPERSRRQRKNTIENQITLLVLMKIFKMTIIHTFRSVF